MSAVVDNARIFTQAALRDHLEAFEQYGSAELASEVRDLNLRVWEGVNEQIGWSYLLGASPMALAGVEGATPLTLHYHPWSDIGVVLAWRREGQTLRIDDVELLVASWFRSPNLPAFGPDPAWTEGEEFLPLAVARAAAQAIGGFEEFFPADFEGDWRARLPLLADKGVADLNEAAVSLRLFRTMARFAALRLPEAERPQRMSVVSAAIDRFRSADPAAVIGEARATPAQTQSALAEQPRWRLRSMAPVAAIPAGPGTLVFLTPSDSPDYFVSLAVDGADEGLIQRIDLVRYAGLVQDLEGGASP